MTIAEAQEQLPVLSKNLRDPAIILLVGNTYMNKILKWQKMK
ncbi:hypothetical protein [Pseudanabaena sp. SR411]|nr:hypothetical protein [Pseudanabaena sp. SR411]